MDTEKLCLGCMQSGVTDGVCSLCGAHHDDAQTVAYALPRGTVLHGRYLVGATLGAGGFGVTYIALDLITEKRLAIKEFLPVDVAVRKEGDTCVYGRTRDDELFCKGRERFLKEAQTIYRLRGYVGVVGVEKLFEENNTAYYCMEYLEGCDLKKYVQQHGGRLHEYEALQLMRPVLDALSYIHANGVIHRDVSPDNIFVCKDGTIKLIDFGAAYAALRDRAEQIQLVVKPGYAPIEQYARNGELGPWSDLYAFACTLYFCLTGQAPLDALQRSAQGALPTPPALDPFLSAETTCVLTKGMAVEAKDRFQSAEAFWSALYPGETHALQTSGARTGAGFASRAAAACRAAFARFRQAIARWIGPVRAAFAQKKRVSGPALVCISGVFAGSVFPLTQTPIRMGRDASRCGIVFPPTTSGVSRTHCEALYDASEAYVIVRDLGSTFGTTLAGGETLFADSEATLKNGARFSIGQETFEVRLT